MAALLGQPKPLDTSTFVQEPDAYYTKSLITPAASPITQDAAFSLFSFMAYDGQTTDLVSFPS